MKKMLCYLLCAAMLIPHAAQVYASEPDTDIAAEYDISYEQAAADEATSEDAPVIEEDVLTADNADIAYEDDAAEASDKDEAAEEEAVEPNETADDYEAADGEGEDEEIVEVYYEPQKDEPFYYDEGGFASIDVYYRTANSEESTPPPRSHRY